MMEGYIYMYTLYTHMPTDESIEQGRNRSGLLRSFSVLAACVVPSDKHSLAWNRDVKHIISSYVRMHNILTTFK